MRSSPQLAEHDLVDLCTKEELVSFSHVSDVYPPTRDLTVHYWLGSRVGAAPLDWIGIFPTDWRDIDSPLAYQWATEQPIPKGKSRQRLVSFPAKVIKPLQHPSRSYQLLYVSNGQQVLGVSQPFKVKLKDGWTMESGCERRADQQWKSMGDSSGQGKADCPEAGSSDEDWDFANQSTVRHDGSTTSDLSDIVILSTSPSKEAARQGSPRDHPGGKDKYQHNQYQRLESFSFSAADDNTTDSQNSDLEEESVLMPVDSKQAGTKPDQSLRDQKARMKASPALNAPSPAECEDVTRAGPKKALSRSMGKRLGKGHGKLMAAKAGEELKDPPLLGSVFASEPSGEEESVRLWVDRSRDYLNVPVPLSIFDRLRILPRADSDGEGFINDDETDDVTESRDKLSPGGKIEVISKSDAGQESKHYTKSKKSKSTPTAEQVADSKVPKKSKHKKHRKKYGGECEVEWNFSEYSTDSKDTNSTVDVVLPVDRRKVTVVFDELGSSPSWKESNKENKRNHQNDAKHKPKKDRKSEQSFRQAITEVQASGETAPGPDECLSDASKRDQERELRHKERKHRRQSKRQQLDRMTELRAEAKARAESEAQCSDDGRDDVSSLSNVPCPSLASTDELKAIRKKYVHTQKTKSKKRKRLQAKNAPLHPQCNLSLLFTEDKESETTCSSEQPTDRPSGATSSLTIATPLSGLLLDDTSEQGFPALPSTHTDTNVSKQTDHTQLDHSLVRFPEVREEFRESPPPEPESDGPEGMAGLYFPPYLLDIMDALPAADQAPDLALAQWKQGRPSATCKVSLERFKAKYKTKFVKRQELRRMKIRRKSYYLNSGVLGGIKYQFTNSMQIGPNVCLTTRPDDLKFGAELPPPQQDVLDMSAQMSNKPLDISLQPKPAPLNSDSSTETGLSSSQHKSKSPPFVPLDPEAADAHVCASNDLVKFPAPEEEAQRWACQRWDKAVDPCVTLNVLSTAPSGAESVTGAGAGRKQGMSYASVVKKSQDEQKCQASSVTAECVVINVPSEESVAILSTQPSSAATPAVRADSCSIGKLLELPAESQHLITTEDNDPGPGLPKARVKTLKSRAVKLLKERENIRQQLKEHIYKMESCEPLVGLRHPAGGISVPLEGSEYMRGNGKHVSPSSPQTLKWPLPSPVEVLSSICTWAPACSLQNGQLASPDHHAFQQDELETGLHLRPTAKVHASQHGNGQSPPKVAKAPVKDPLKQSVEMISEDVIKTGQKAQLDLALAQSLAENKDLKVKMMRMEAQLEEMEAQLQQLEKEQSSGHCPSLTPSKAKIRNVRHRRMAICKTAGDLKTLVRSNVELICLKSKVRQSDQEIDNLESQISALKEALSVESNRAMKAHLKWLKMKTKVRSLKSRLTAYKYVGQGQELSGDSEGMELSEAEQADEMDTSEPPTKRRRVSWVQSTEDLKVVPGDEDDQQNPQKKVRIDSKVTTHESQQGSPLKAVKNPEPLAMSTAESLSFPVSLHNSYSAHSSGSSTSSSLLPCPPRHGATVCRKPIPVGHEPHSDSTVLPTSLYSALQTAHVQPVGPYVLSHPSHMTCGHTTNWTPHTRLSSNDQSSHGMTPRRSSPPHLPLPHPSHNSTATQSRQQNFVHFSPAPGAAPGSGAGAGPVPPAQAQPGASQVHQHPHYVLHSPSPRTYPVHAQAYLHPRRSTPPHLPLPSPPYISMGTQPHPPRHTSISPPRQHPHPPKHNNTNGHHSRSQDQRTDATPTARPMLSTANTNSHQHSLNPFQNPTVHPPAYSSALPQPHHPQVKYNQDSFSCWSPKSVDTVNSLCSMYNLPLPFDYTASFKPRVSDVSIPEFYTRLPEAEGKLGQVSPPLSSSGLAFASNAAFCQDRGQSGTSGDLQSLWLNRKTETDARVRMCDSSTLGQRSEIDQWRGLGRSSALGPANSPPVHDSAWQMGSQYQSYFMRKLVKDESDIQQHKQSQAQQQQQQQHQQQQQQQLATDYSQSYLTPGTQQSTPPRPKHSLFPHTSSVSPPKHISDIFSFMPSGIAKHNPFRLFQKDLNVPDHLTSDMAQSEGGQQKKDQTASNLHQFYQQLGPVSGSSSSLTGPTLHISGHVIRPGEFSSANFQNTKSVVELNAHGLISSPHDSHASSSLDKRLIEARAAMHHNA